MTHSLTTGMLSLEMSSLWSIKRLDLADPKMRAITEL